MPPEVRLDNNWPGRQVAKNTLKVDTAVLLAQARQIEDQVLPVLDNRHATGGPDWLREEAELSDALGRWDTARMINKINQDEYAAIATSVDRLIRGLSQIAERLRDSAAEYDKAEEENAHKRRSELSALQGREPIPPSSQAPVTRSGRV